MDINLSGIFLWVVVAGMLLALGCLDGINLGGRLGLLFWPLKLIYFVTSSKSPYRIFVIVSQGPILDVH